MAKKDKQQSYEIAVGLKKGHKVTKNERKKPRPSQMKGVSLKTLSADQYFMSYFQLIMLTNKLSSLLLSK